MMNVKLNIKVRYKQEAILYLFSLLSIGYSAFLLSTWYSYYKLELGNYSTIQVNVDSTFNSKIVMNITPEILSIKYNISINGCDKLKMKMNYKYSQDFLSKNIMIYDGSLLMDSYNERCRLISMYSIGRDLGYGNEMIIDLVNNNRGSLCFRNKKIGLYCFKNNSGREFVS
ncbi:hypothetical protein [Moritella sp. Urea-trap-13]|uniref:hypothetical protein n=1 Tax=Moritella sp. Urea-trap-13 TaxID=2058327 RepID=UPI000CA89A26|nr:hypothetical protein [Moritella sp. Urea-trap-13]PKH09387.1 hypothetical protein CXF93_00650 [Moritella sp. Urea-trap-13]